MQVKIKIWKFKKAEKISAWHSVSLPQIVHNTNQTTKIKLSIHIRHLRISLLHKVKTNNKQNYKGEVQKQSALKCFWSSVQMILIPKGKQKRILSDLEHLVIWPDCLLKKKILQRVWCWIGSGVIAHLIEHSITRKPNYSKRKCSGTLEMWKSSFHPKRMNATLKVD